MNKKEYLKKLYKALRYIKFMCSIILISVFDDILKSLENNKGIKIIGYVYNVVDKLIGGDYNVKYMSLCIKYHINESFIFIKELIKKYPYIKYIIIEVIVNFLIKIFPFLKIFNTAYGFYECYLYFPLIIKVVYKFLTECYRISKIILENISNLESNIYYRIYLAGEYNEIFISEIILFVIQLCKTNKDDKEDIEIFNVLYNIIMNKLN